jgi:hypothetical protein
MSEVYVKPTLRRGRVVAYSVGLVKGQAIISFGVERGGYRIALNHAAKVRALLE